MSSPAVSVAMSVYNGERFLSEAIESVLGQTFSDFEFLILDDGSRDSSRAIIERYAAGDRRIRLISRENRGLVASLNQLLEEARAPLVARMDADDICRPDRFARQVGFFAANPDYGVVGSWTEHIGEDAGREASDWADFPNAPADGLDNHGGSGCQAIEWNGWPKQSDSTGQPLTHKDFLREIETRRVLLCHSSVMYRRDVVRKVGGYHSAFTHCEDLDLWLRLAAVTKLGNIPERLIRYRRYPGQVSNRYATDQQVGAAIARIAHEERSAGRPDPTADLDSLPPIAELDALFGRRGIAQLVREQVLEDLRYSRDGMGDHGFDMLLDYIRDGGSHAGLWKTVLRVGSFGYPLRAIRLVAALMATSPQPARRIPRRLTTSEGAA